MPKKTSWLGDSNNKKRERFAVIGLGHFGGYVARTLYESGKEVIALDMDPEIVRDAAAFSTNAVVVDATDRPALEAAGLGEVDVAVISLGERMDIITLAALHVKELGVPYVAVKALSEEHGRILKALGVDEIIHPEKDSAIRLGHRLAHQDLVDLLPLMPGYSIAQMRTPPEFVGKSLRELSLRNRLSVQLVAIQREGGSDRRVNILPKAEDVLLETDILFLLGEDRDLDRIREIAKGS
ncbi:MAG: TrkA family potassium uptake protein [Bryobacteraceae bacterium]|nr:TrkA family potassium uptake protein [Bryobacteraceae bacterium]MDW8377696.1 TrkA family potassium uptake protein [Bryobacterales bacterium]